MQRTNILTKRLAENDVTPLLYSKHEHTHSYTSGLSVTVKSVSKIITHLHHNIIPPPKALCPHNEHQIIVSELTSMSININN